MSEEQMEQQEHSAEDKFFGVKTVIGKKSDEEAQDSDVDIEIIDDRPPEDRRPPAKEAKAEAKSDESDDELEGYSEKVKKRINKLRYQQHESAASARRQSAFMKRLSGLLKSMRTKAQYQKSFRGRRIWFIRYESELLWLSIAKNTPGSLEEGNTDKILEAQEALINAQSELKSADYQLNEIKHRPKQEPEEFKAPEPEKPQVHQEPSAKALKWSKDNLGLAKKKDMTALAYGVQKNYSGRGLRPQPDEYFEAIDRTMRSRFQTTSVREIVAQTNRLRTSSLPRLPKPFRGSGASLGITARTTQSEVEPHPTASQSDQVNPEQYANQLIKES